MIYLDRIFIFIPVSPGGSGLDKTLLKKAAFQSVALMLGVIVLSIFIRQYNGIAISASTDDTAFGTGMGNEDSVREMDLSDGTAANIPEEIISADKDEDSVINPIFLNATTGINDDIMAQMGDTYLVIKKPEGENLQLQVEDIYINKQLKLVMSGFMLEKPDVGHIGRANADEIFVGEPKHTQRVTLVVEDGGYIPVVTKDYGNDPVNGIEISSKTDDFGYSTHEITLQLNHVYAHIVYEDEYYYYIDLKRPREVYDRILVIDAGHGGLDSGAVSKDGRIYEKNLNLGIILALKELLDKENIKVYYTRIQDNKVYLRPRVDLANDVDCDFFISIHCNSGGDNTRKNGTEILYYDYTHKGIASKDLAELFSEEIAKVTTLKNKGIVRMKDDDVLILHHAVVPAVLVEAGYITNSGDLEYLKTKEGQEAAALGIYNGIMRAYSEFMNQE